MRKLHKKKKGSALLVAILLSAIIGAAALGVNAIAIRQVNISETYNNGLVAFYSAESGLEEGLLRYRFDKNIQIPTTTGNTLDNINRQPTNTFRNFLNLTPMRESGSSDSGVPLGYMLSDKSQVYDLQVYYQQKYFGEDINNDGVVNQVDVANINYGAVGTPYRIIKDEAKEITIVGSGDDNKIFLYWRWTTSCQYPHKRAIEVKLKIDEANPASRDEYSAVFSDPTCGTSGKIANADIPSTLEGGVFTPLAGSDLKAKMNISALKIKEMTIKPVNEPAHQFLSINIITGEMKWGPSYNDTIVFGFAQGNNAGNPNNPAKTVGPTTTIKSIGYFSGATREFVANIDRQNGAILDIFQYVIYKGEIGSTPTPTPTPPLDECRQKPTFCTWATSGEDIVHVQQPDSGIWCPAKCPTVISMCPANPPAGSSLINLYANGRATGEMGWCSDKVPQGCTSGGTPTMYIRYPGTTTWNPLSCSDKVPQGCTLGNWVEVSCGVIGYPSTIQVQDPATGILWNISCPLCEMNPW